MPRFLVSLVLLVLSVPMVAAPKRRAVQQPAALTPEAIIAAASKAADRVTLSFHPRLHWENAVYFDGLVLLGEQMELRSPGSGGRFIERAVSVILGSDDPIDTVHWGDGTAFAQASMDLYRVLPPNDPRRDAILATLSGPMRFAEHAVRVTPAAGAARDPWWIAGGYGARFWQDDLYMVVPWLALYGSAQDGLPGNELARNLTYEWIEAYVHEHRPASADPREAAVPSSASRRGTLLWDETHSLFQHAPESIGTTEHFWARGNGWALVALARAAESLDAPYTGGRYDQVVGREELRELLRKSAASLIARRTPDGGWGSFLSNPDACPVAETSGTALLTFFLARGVNEGWLDRDVYAPVVTRALALLLRRIDGEGVVSGIQPPDVGPGCGKIASSHATINVNYGPGAILLAAAEVLKFPQEDLLTSSRLP
ncbi:MAG TPA: glycoside hydrolase family 88 protein [Thermoanaerobaculia bacterium]|nr:glycoside hydrolase family 88 protein [Thermoanaerobaculia bacterium]